MKRAVVLAVFLLVFVLLVSVSFVGASWFSDLFDKVSGKITGHAWNDPYTENSCIENYIGDYENWLYAKRECEVCSREGGKCHDVYEKCLVSCPSCNCIISAMAASFFYAREPYMEKVCIPQEPGEPEECHDEVTRPAGFFNCYDGKLCPSGTKAEINCSDKVDNDNDGLIDCKDGDCKYDVNCLGCPSGQTKCSGVCVDLDSDDDNCGSCGKKCLEDKYCDNKICKLEICKDANGVNKQDCITSCGENRYCLSGDCVLDKDKDSFITKGVYQDVAEKKCSGDCDDNSDDDPAFCLENGLCPSKDFYGNWINVNYSVCARCIKPNAHEFCYDKVNNDCDSAEDLVIQGGTDCEDWECIDCGITGSGGENKKCSVEFDKENYKTIVPGMCYNKICVEDKDGDNYIPLAVDNPDDSNQRCLGDCDDNFLDSPEICWDSFYDDTGNPIVVSRDKQGYSEIESKIICPYYDIYNNIIETKYSVCAKCIHSSAIEVCDGVDNNCKGRCEGKVVNGKFGEKECELNWITSGVDSSGGYSTDCSGLELYGPNGADFGNGYCQMIDDNVVVNERTCGGLSQCTKSGGYVEENINKININNLKNVEPNVVENNGGYAYLIEEKFWGGGGYILLPGPSINIKENWIFNPASSSNSECHHSYLLKTINNYETFSQAAEILILDYGFEQVDCYDIYKCKYEKEVVVANCLPASEKIVAENPDSGNIAGFYNYFVEDNRDTEVYPSEQIMKGLSWQTSCAIKDKCADKLDNDGEENLKQALFNNYNYQYQEQEKWTLRAICCQYDSGSYVYKPILEWKLVLDTTNPKACGTITYEQVLVEGERLDDSKCVEVIGAKPDDKVIEIKGSNISLIDVDDLDCHHDSNGVILPYCLDEDNDGYCGCLKPEPWENYDPSQDADTYHREMWVEIRMRSCDNNRMKIDGYGAGGVSEPLAIVDSVKKTAYLPSNLFPDCDDNPADDNLLEEMGGYRKKTGDNPINFKFIYNTVVAGSQTTMSRDIEANLVHPFQTRPFYSPVGYGISSDCYQDVNYIDLNCNENLDEGYYFDKLNEGISPFDYDRTTGVENAANEGKIFILPYGSSPENVDLFCRQESFNSITINNFVKPVLKQFVSIGVAIVLFVPAAALFPAVVPYVAAFSVGFSSYNLAVYGTKCVIKLASTGYDIQTAELCGTALGSAGGLVLSTIGLVKTMPEEGLFGIQWTHKAAEGMQRVGKISFFGKKPVNQVLAPSRNVIVEKLPDGVEKATITVGESNMPEYRAPGEAGKTTTFFVSRNAKGELRTIFVDVTKSDAGLKGYTIYEATSYPFFGDVDSIGAVPDIIAASEEVYNSASFTAASVPTGASAITQYNPPMPVPSSWINSNDFIFFGSPVSLGYACINCVPGEMNEIAKTFGVASSVSPEGQIVDSIESIKELAGQKPQLAAGVIGKCLPGDSCGPIGGDCFLPGTPILLANGSYIDIENVKVGDEVMSYDLENNKKTTGKVVKNFERKMEEYLIIEYEYEN
jgi:hypothetical protein